MQSLKLSSHAALLLAALVCVVPAGSALAQDDAAKLREVVRLFDQGEYLAAQELLAGIDRDALSPEQQTRRDDYLERIQTALVMYEKALRNLEDAETAIAENDLEEARTLLQEVLDNPYAAPPLKDAAEDHLDDLLSDAAREDAEARIEALDAARFGREPGPAAPAPAGQPTDLTRARTLTDEGYDLLRGAEYDAAEQRFNDALDLVPGYPEAVEGLQQLQLHRENIAGTRAETLADRLRRLDAINWQRAVAQYREQAAIVRQLVAENNYDAAKQALVRARQIVEAGGQFAEPAQYEELRSEVAALAEFVESSERQFVEQQVAATREEIMQLREQRLREYEQQKEQQIAALMEEAFEHRKNGNLDAAISALQQVVVIDPRYQPARWMMDMLEDRRHYRMEAEIRETFYDKQREALIDVEAAKIPWWQEIKYPDEWLEIINRPERRMPGEDAVDRRLIGALDSRVPVDIQNTPFEQVIHRFADAHGINIIVDWHDLAQAGVKRDHPIDLNLPSEITLRKALTEVLHQAGAGVDLDFHVRDNTISVATRDRLRRQTYTQVYDVTDLLMEIPHFTNAPAADLRGSMPKAAESASLPWIMGDDDDDEAESDREREDRIRQVMDIIRTSIEPDSWREVGGDIGTIKEINGQLVVTQNAAAHGRIIGLLDRLRAERAVQVSVEALFITVSSHYLEEMGIDLDIMLNAGNAGYDYVASGTAPALDPVLGSPLLIPRTFSRLGYGQAVPTGVGTQLSQGAVPPQPFTQAFLVPQTGSGSGSQLTPVPVQNNVLAFTNPADLPSDVPGSFGGQPLPPALSIFGSFLDNIQVDFLVRATQADSRTTVLTAPRLVVFNGASAWIAVTVQQNFVSQLQPVVAQGAVAQAPQTGTIDAGASLFVRATVTPDRRYVMMLLAPGVTRLLDLQTFQFSGGTLAGQAFVQLPTLSAQRVQTLVSVPDGGTLLIGGQKLASETEVEAGVPILSKIPVLKRLYSSKTMIKDEQVLLILIKPRILIQSEQEELAFPGFAGR